MALEKLNIQAFSDPACTKKVTEPINAFINPESYTTNSTINYEDVQQMSAPKGTMVFAGVGSDTLTLNKLVVDGTGIVSLGTYKSVDDYLDAFRKIVYEINGQVHRPNYLKVIWGTRKFIGVCTSFNVNYTLFRPDGVALRAFIDLVVQSSTDLRTKSKEAAFQSPDLTHMRTVMAGDTLPLMAYRIYGDSSHYLLVAKENNLKNLHALKPGDQLYFPPLKKR